MDKRLFVLGTMTIVVGLSVSIYINAITQQDSDDNMHKDNRVLLLKQQKDNDDKIILAGILSGIGFLLMLISFGIKKSCNN